jgi:uncharacterized membrane protein YdbT with pleckstrin-like domain
MGLSTEQLSEGEHILLEMHEHWKHLLGAALVCVAALVGLLVVLAVGPDSGAFAWLDKLGWIAFAGVAAVFGLWPFTEWRRRTYTLTDKRLATRRGVLRRSGRDIPISRINDVAFEQGLLDRMVGAGTLRVSAASEEGTVVMRDIPHIHDVTRQLNELVRAAG